MSNTAPAIPPAPSRARLQKKARNWIFVALIALFVTLPTFYFVEPIFFWIVGLNGLDFGVLSITLGLAMALGPVAAVVGLLMALFWRVEACFTPDQLGRTLTDRMSIGVGLLVSFVPAIVALYPPIKAILTGYIGFRGPGQQYFRAEDPYGFWQATAFWMMGAATLAILAGLYWRAKMRGAKKTPPPAQQPQ